MTDVHLFKNDKEEFLCKDGKPCSYKYIDYKKVCRHGLCEDTCPLEKQYRQNRDKWSKFFDALDDLGIKIRK